MADKAYYRKLIVDKKLQLSRERDAKKRDNESYARQIKSAVSPSSKASLKKSKIQRAADHDRKIAYIREEIARLQLNLAKAK